MTIPTAEHVGKMSNAIYLACPKEVADDVSAALRFLASILKPSDAGRELEALCNEWGWNTHTQGPPFTILLDLARRFAARIAVLEGQLAPMTTERNSQPEPVAWVEHHKGGDNLVWEKTNLPCDPLYASPPAPEGKVMVPVESVERTAEQIVSTLHAEFTTYNRAKVVMAINKMLAAARKG